MSSQATHSSRLMTLSDFNICSSCSEVRGNTQYPVFNLFIVQLCKNIAAFHPIFGVMRSAVAQWWSKRVSCKVSQVQSLTSSGRTGKDSPLNSQRATASQYREKWTSLMDQWSDLGCIHFITFSQCFVPCWFLCFIYALSHILKATSINLAASSESLAVISMLIAFRKISLLQTH